jgi:hypothetical protein
MTDGSDRERHAALVHEVVVDGKVIKVGRILLNCLQPAPHQRDPNIHAFCSHAMTT